MELGEWLENLAKDRSLHGEDFRVLLVLMANVDINTARLSQSEIARIIELKESNVSRSIKNLVQKGIITKEMNGEKTTGYRFLFDG